MAEYSSIEVDPEGRETEVFTDQLCIVCKHPPCPCCMTWCDNTVAMRDGLEWDELCCDGECTYPEKPTFWTRSEGVKVPH